jgi:hypothetical protein
MTSEEDADQFIERFMANTKCVRVEEIEERFGMELGDIVYDLKGEERASVYNGDIEEGKRLLLNEGFSEEQIGGLDEAAQLDMLDDIFTREGEEINNQGIYAQAAYLVAELTDGKDPIAAADEVAKELGFPARGEPLSRVL